MRFVFTFLLSFSTLFALSGQTEVAANAEAKRFFIGLNLTPTITGLLGSADELTLTDLYLITFRAGSERRRARFALNFRINNDKSDQDFTGVRKTKRSGFDLRAGGEWAFPVSRHFDFYWGWDGLFGTNRNVVETGFGGSAEIKETAFSIGTGPAVGLMWRLHPRLFLSTESTVYAVYTKSKRKVNAFPDVTNDDFSSFNFRPQLPVSVFLNFKF